MDEHIDPCPKVERLIPIMDLVRKTADMNSAYLDQVRADLQQAHQLSERIQRMKRQDLALLVRRFQTSLERKLEIASGMLGDFCTMVVLHGWVLVHIKMHGKNTSCAWSCCLRHTTIPCMGQEPYRNTSSGRWSSTSRSD